MSALFNFSSFVVVLLLTICTCTYVKGKGGTHRTHPYLSFSAPALTAPPPACSLDAAPYLLNERTG